MEYYSAIKKNKILPFAATWTDLEIIILSEVSQAEKGKYYIIYIWNLKNNTNDIHTKQKKTHRHRKQTYGTFLMVQWARIILPMQGTQV